MTPEDVVGLLAEEHRMQVLAAVALGAATHAQVLMRCDLPSKSVSIALQRLVAAGLVTGDPLQVSYDALRQLAATSSSRAVEGPDDGLGPFIRGHRLTSLPASPARRHVVLEHIVSSTFEVGTDYTEPEVNDALRQWCEGGEIDHVALRRYLVDGRLLVRRAGRYWIPTGELPELGTAESHVRALGLA